MRDRSRRRAHLLADRGPPILGECHVEPRAEGPDAPGMYIMDTPGHGAESVTGIGAGGAHFMVISTGQGHTLSNAVMPTIKVTGNPNSAERVPEETDVDVSEALVGDRDFEWATDQLWDEIVEVVNGKVTLSEALGESQFAIHRIGPST